MDKTVFLIKVFDPQDTHTAKGSYWPLPASNFPQVCYEQLDCHILGMFLLVVFFLLEFPIIEHNICFTYFESYNIYPLPYLVTFASIRPPS